MSTNHGGEANKSKSETPGTPEGLSKHFLIPSPVPTRRNRTYSACERAALGPEYKGVVKEFCRERGHGFIIPSESPSQTLFVHISDVDGEFIPKAGDEVKFKKLLIPPRNEKVQAVHVTIIHLTPDSKHERWDSPAKHDHIDHHPPHEIHGIIGQHHKSPAASGASPTSASAGAAAAASNTQ